MLGPRRGRPAGRQEANLSGAHLSEPNLTGKRTSGRRTPTGPTLGSARRSSTGSRSQIVSAISALWSDGWWFRTPRRPPNSSEATPLYLWPKKRRGGKLPVTSNSRLASILKHMFEFGLVIWKAAMLQNMPLLNRVLGTAALASVITALLMSHQFSRGSEPPMAKVIRLHAK